MAGAVKPIAAETWMDRKTYRDLQRALRGRATTSTGGKLLWTIVAVGLLLGAVAGAAYWARHHTEWRYIGEETGFVPSLFLDGDAFTPAFLMMWFSALGAMLMFRLLLRVGVVRAKRASRERAAIFNGAKVSIAPSGVSLSGPEFGTHYGWRYVEEVYDGRASVVLVVPGGGLILAKDSFDRPLDTALEQIELWRWAAAQAMANRGRR